MAGDQESGYQLAASVLAKFQAHNSVCSDSEMLEQLEQPWPVQMTAPYVIPCRPKVKDDYGDENVNRLPAKKNRYSDHNQELTYLSDDRTENRAKNR